MDSGSWEEISPFIALYSIHMSIDYQEFDNFDDAMSMLNFGSDTGQCMPIAIFDNHTNEIVWFEQFLGEEECKKVVDNYLIGIYK